MIFGVVGLIGAGKNTVADMILNRTNGIQESFAAPLKDVTATVFGWDRALLEGDTSESREFRETEDKYWSNRLGMPHVTPRYMLQYLGTELFRNAFHQDIWLDSLAARMRNVAESQTVVISDARFVNELNMISALGGKLILVKRGADPEWFGTAATANRGDETAKIEMAQKYHDVHESESAWAGHRGFDVVFENDSDLELLNAKVEQYLEWQGL